MGARLGGLLCFGSTVADAQLSIAQVAPSPARRREPDQRVRRPRLRGARGGAGTRWLRIGTGEPVKRLLKARPFDIVHVHEPFAPSVSSAALRHSFSLNVATFHAPQERVLSTQVARPLVEIFFGRIDARTVTSAATGGAARELLPRQLRAGRAGRGGARLGGGRRRAGSDLPAPAGAPPRPTTATPSCGRGSPSGR